MANASPITISLPRWDRPPALADLSQGGRERQSGFAGTEPCGRRDGWSDETGPFGKVVPPGARVLIKPNMVLHRNEGGGGLECLVTHPSLIRAVAEAALRTGAKEVLVGDAPVQGCDFDALVDGNGLRSWAREQTAATPIQRSADFRRTTCVMVEGVRVANENLQPLDDFRLFDLGRESMLEPISNGQHRFRVAWYDHRLLAKAHHRVCINIWLRERWSKQMSSLISQN